MAERQICKGCSFRLSSIPQQSHTSASTASRPSAAIPIAREDTDSAIIRQIADYERISGIVWIILGAIQTLSVVGAIAGLWNIYAGYTRFQTAPRILARDTSIPAAFEDLSSYIVIGVINLVLGGVIGVIFVGLDLYIRDLILKNRHLFTTTSTTSVSS